MFDKSPTPYIAFANNSNVGQFATYQEAVNALNQAGSRMKVFQQQMILEIKDANNGYNVVGCWRM